MRLRQLSGPILVATLLSAAGGACGSNDNDANNADGGAPLSHAEEFCAKVCAKPKQCAPDEVCACPTSPTAAPTWTKWTRTSWTAPTALARTG